MYLVYDEVSPFTGERSVMIEYDDTVDDRMLICMDTGYVTYDKLWREDEDYHEMLRLKMPETIWDTRKIVNGRVWYKLCISDVLVDFKPEIVDGVEVWVIYKLKHVSHDYDGDKRLLIVRLDDDDDDDTLNTAIYRAVDLDTRVEFPSTDFSAALSMCQEIRAAECELLDEEIEKIKSVYLQQKGDTHETSI